MLPFLEFRLEGEAVGKGRPRFDSRRGTPYTPDKTSAAERAIAWVAKAAMGARSPLTTPVGLEVLVLRQFPKSYTVRERAQTFPTSKPDLDNVLKLIGDACNKIIWKDDAQIARVVMERRFIASPSHIIVKVLVP